MRKVKPSPWEESRQKLAFFAGSCLRKVRFKSRSRARHAAKKVNSHTGVTFYAYHCLHCDGFHLTKQWNPDDPVPANSETSSGE